MWKEEGLSHLSLFVAKDIFVLGRQKMYIVGRVASEE